MAYFASFLILSSLNLVLGSSDKLLVLDPSIRDWVVIPLLFLVIFVGIGRNYVQILIKSNPTITESDLNEMRYKQTLAQSMRLRVNGKYLNERAYTIRKSYLIRKKVGALREKVPGPSNPMSNPLAMMDMMKGNFTFMIPNFIMMAFVGYFFSGFVCLKIPFPMPSSNFRLMLQRGVDISNLDVSYVSSLSWYFLVTFGLNGIYKLILGGDFEFDEAKMMQMQMGMGMAPGQQMGFNASAAYKAERSALGIAKHEWIGDNYRAEKELLGDRFPDSFGPSNLSPVDLSSFEKPAN